MKTRLFRQAVGELISAERIFPPEHNRARTHAPMSIAMAPTERSRKYLIYSGSALFNLMCSYALLHDNRLTWGGLLI